MVELSASRLSPWRVRGDHDRGPHWADMRVRGRLGDAFRSHGERPPGRLTGISQLVAVGTGRRGTRSARLLGLVARVVAGGIRWTWQRDAGADAKDRRGLRHMYVSYGALIGIAVLLTAGAVRASGWRRLPWAVIALLTWLFTAWSVAIGAVVTTVVTGGKDRSGSRSTTGW